MVEASQRSIVDAIITPQLWVRKSREPNIAAEAAAILRIADTVATDPSKVIQVCADLALELCDADTCGVSVCERNADANVFRWIAMAGQLKQQLHGTAPGADLPCGVRIDSGEPMLMRHPERVYEYFDIGLPCCEVLRIPLVDCPLCLDGAIWIVAHTPGRKFDSEDARVMQRIAVFTNAALHLAKYAQEAQKKASEQELLLRELDHRFRNTLAMTASLLHRQLVGALHPEARDAIEAVSGRVLALGQVHQICSQATTGDLVEIVKGICTTLVGADPRFELEFTVEPVVVAVHKAAVVALIINELVTNAMKHALSDRLTGKIGVSLCRTERDSIALSVSDDGDPLSMSAEEPTAGIGLNLIARLAAQLDGEIEIAAQPKRFTLVFPASTAA